MARMLRPFAWYTAALTLTVGVLVGVVLAGTMTPAPATSAPSPAVAIPARLERRPVPALIDFADVAERATRAVVSIDAASRRRRRNGMSRPRDGGRFEGRGPRDEDRVEATGTGVLIDAAGHVLTNEHVIDGAERVTVTLADGRAVQARFIGADADIDIALLKVESDGPLPFVPLGDSARLRVGEWVCAIGNPLTYERTVTVGVVSFLGRKLFDQSLDDYIQTDAAISFGNSGGPLLNGRGEVVGINAAVSRQASNIGFAVPINQARAILPQLMASGRVSRGYMGVALRRVDPDVRRALNLPRADGALVQDVTVDSPAARAGLRPYDLVVSVEGRPVLSDDALIRDIAERRPGTQVRLDLLRDGRAMGVVVKLAERPARETSLGPPPASRRPEPQGPAELGLSLIEISAANAARYDVGAVEEGLLIQRVEPMSAAGDAGLRRGTLILQVNRRTVATVAGFRRVVDALRPGDPLALYVYDPADDQHAIVTVRTDAR